MAVVPPHRFDDPEPAGPERTAARRGLRSPRARFRVIPDRTRDTPPPRGGLFRSPVLLLGFPLLGLLIYVFSWTVALRGGYHQRALETRLHDLQVQEKDLEADKRRLQNPRNILARARALGMQPPAQQIFRRLPEHRYPDAP